MSINRYAKKRDVNEPEIIKAFKALGATVESIDTPCDLIIGFRGVSVLVEVKTEKGGLTKNQKEFIRNWKGSYFIVRNVEQALDIVKKLKIQ